MMSAGTATVQFVGTATTLLRYADRIILTDPNFAHRGERAYPLFTSPLTDFTDELTRRCLAERVRLVRRGEIVGLTGRGGHGR